MSNFALSVNTPYQNVISSLNYALSNLNTVTSNANVVIGGNVVQVNANTGQIYTSNIGTINYLYGYVDVAYADTSTGGGFSVLPTNKDYYGVRNTTSPIFDTNPVDYAWTKVTGGFGTTKELFYTTGGGNTISFQVGTSAPNEHYSPIAAGVPILLAQIAANTVVTNSIQDQAITNVQIASNTIQGNNIQAGTITGNLVAANTIQGSSIVAGSITSVQINANAIIVSNSIQSNNATFGNISSAGFWLDSNTGNVRFGGNTSIGTNLTVGNNAVIGGNLTVAGLITSGNLQTNTVTTTTMVTSAVSSGVGLNTTTANAYPFPNSVTIYTYANLQPSITTVVAGEAVYVNAQISARLGFNSSSLISVNTYLFRNGVQLGGVNNFYVINGQAGIYSYITPSFTYYDTPFSGTTGTATYSIGILLSGTSGTNVSTLEYLGGTMVLQGMKR